jgi:hypothetical protein
MLPQLDTYDWREVFKREYCTPDPAVPGQKIDLSSFTIDDVASIINMDEGENDEKSWIICCQLKDGRFAYVEAHCDYTGWG